MHIYMFTCIYALHEHIYLHIHIYVYIFAYLLGARVGTCLKNLEFFTCVSFFNACSAFCIHLYMNYCWVQRF